MKRFLIFLLVLGLIVVTACSDDDKDDLGSPIYFLIGELEEVGGKWNYYISLYGADLDDPKLYYALQSSDSNTEELILRFDDEEGSYYVTGVGLVSGEEYYFWLKNGEREFDLTYTIPHKVLFDSLFEIPEKYDNEGFTFYWKVGNESGEKIRPSYQIFGFMQYPEGLGPYIDDIFEEKFTGRVGQEKRSYQLPAGKLTDGWTSAEFFIENYWETTIQTVTIIGISADYRSVEPVDGDPA